ncbi:unnamed protein product [Moneuplotes crassus]|uniref:Uncharacterized protein n=1 Tax=Euplotes crassus TaxID=5936 RepID=A0AAD1XGM0_EUPCR|nr:unnamed protein product [Moneuplotes crassus]
MNPYSQVPENRDASSDNNFGAANPPVSINYQQPVGILHGPGYKLVQAQSRVHKYSWYIKLVGWIFIILGGLRAATYALRFLDTEEIDIEFNESKMEDNDIEVPAGPLAFANFLDTVSACLTILMGYLFIKTAETPTRTSTWRLYKKTLAIILVQFLFLVLAYLAVFIGFGIAFDEWMKDERRSPGEYRLRHKSSGQEFHIKKHSEGERANNDDLREMEGISAIVFMSLMMAFSIACCCATMYSACILGGLYKYHYNARELEIIQDLPSVNQVNMQQMPHYQAHPQPHNSAGVIVRGHVIATPSINDP